MELMGQLARELGLREGQVAAAVELKRYTSRSPVETAV